MRDTEAFLFLWISLFLPNLDLDWMTNDVYMNFTLLKFKE